MVQSNSELQHAATKAQIRASLIGNEQQPLLVIDDFWPEPAQLLHFALQQGKVTAATGLYPGLRSPAPAVFGTALVQQLGSVMLQLFGVHAAQISHIDSYYSLVCTPAKQLLPLQAIPHFDRPQPRDLAVIYYLCDAHHGGTSFYRHRRSGFEAILPERQQSYQQQLAEDFREYGQPTGYINGDSPMFQRIASVPARRNRLVMYRCSSLHSGDIATDYNYDLNPSSGRLTITAFLSCSDALLNKPLTP